MRQLLFVALVWPRESAASCREAPASKRASERKATSSPKLHLPEPLQPLQRLLVRVRIRVRLAETAVYEAPRPPLLPPPAAASRQRPRASRPTTSGSR